MNEGYISYESDGKSAEAFSVEVQRAKACVIVLHEVWGLVPHIQDVCKRISKLGFTTIAPNLYRRRKELFTPEMMHKAMESVWSLSLEERYDIERVRETIAGKGYPKKVLELVTTLYSPKFRNQMLNDVLSGTKYARSRYKLVGSIGFSMGGGLCFKLATRFRDLSSCAVFYGEPPETKEVKRINAPMLTICSGRDEIINSKIPAFVEEAFKTRKDLTLKLYPSSKHGFFNETNKLSYDKEAAEDAWSLTRSFLHKTLG